MLTGVITQRLGKVIPRENFKKKFDRCFLTMKLNYYLPDSFICSSIVFYERMNRHERMNIRMNMHVFGNPMRSMEFADTEPRFLLR